jgi:hypothetical protein
VRGKKVGWGNRAKEATGLSPCHLVTLFLPLFILYFIFFTSRFPANRRAQWDSSLH